MLICSKCKKNVKKIKQETFGCILILSIIPADLILGINIVSICYDILSVAVGLKWILTKPSKNYVCEECSNRETGVKS